MLKQLVIFTQYSENYGSAELPHWKHKGGDIYVIRGLSETADIDALKLLVAKCVTVENDSWTENVIAAGLGPDGHIVWDNWEDPTMLTPLSDGSGFAAVRVQHSMGVFRDGIVSKTTHFKLMPNARSGGDIFYTLSEGVVVSARQLEQALHKLGK